MLEPPRAGGSVFMRIFNPDGSEAEACGNATRCIASLLNPAAPQRIETLGGMLDARTGSDGRISVDMGMPSFDARAIPLAEDRDTLDLHLADVPGPASAVGMGNPHCVILVEDADAVDIAALGPRIEHHPLFPARTNVEVMSVRDRSAIRMRVWERGAGITPACGSGACAAAVAAMRRGLTERSVHVALDGGILDITWRGDDHVIMTGPVATSFSGVLDASILDEAAP